jgi:iron-sulfur cluster assembly protein
MFAHSMASSCISVRHGLTAQPAKLQRPAAQLQASWLSLPKSRTAPASRRGSRFSTRAEGATAAPVKPVISLTDKALAHLRKLRAESGGDELLLRIGVKSGGCSGMSYMMDFEEAANVRSDDAVMEYEGGFRLVCDSKSLLYLFGMNLDYSNALIGGGFQFQNPNATDSCGCGKSFGV